MDFLTIYQNDEKRKVMSFPLFRLASKERNEEPDEIIHHKNCLLVVGDDKGACLMKQQSSTTYFPPLSRFLWLDAKLIIKDVEAFHVSSL